MFDIFCDIWKNPGNTFTPMPFWFWNDRLDRDTLIHQIDDFHKKGVDGFIIHPRMGLETEYLSEEYFDMVEACLEAAEKRHMLVGFYDEAMYPSGSAHGEVVRIDKRYAARALYAVRTEETPADAEILYRMWLSFNADGLLTDVKLDAADGYVSYDFILGYTGGTIRGITPDEDDGQANAPAAADLLNPSAVQEFTKLTHEKYYARLSPYFGKTVIGFFTDEPSVTGRCADMNGKLSWTYGMLEEFFECGGDFIYLAALLFQSESKKLAREAGRIYKKALQLRLGGSFYKTLSDWCRTHGVALMGHPAGSADCEMMKYFDIPGQDLVWRMVEEGTELTSPDSVMAKCAADAARHMGVQRNSNECFGVCGKAGNPWDFTADDMMWYLNFLFARGCNMIIPHAFYYSVRTPVQSNERPPDVGPNNIWWRDYKKLALYIKRMSWLNYAGSNNPDAAVLCSAEHMPVRPVEELYKRGYTFNYLTTEELMERAHIHDGKICIDRYHYDIVLVDGRLPLDAAIVEKLGRFVIEGGQLHRGSGFIDFMEKHAVRKSYFTSDNPHDNLRFCHITKSGCNFFMMFNEGKETISGSLITDQNGAAYRFDPFTGKTAPICAKMCEHGFSYEVSVPAHSVYIIGVDPDALVKLAEDDGCGNSETIAEIVSLTPDASGFMEFERRDDTVRVMLSFTGIHDIVDITVNDKPAGRLMLMPYELDITDLTETGVNKIGTTVTGSIANVYGKPTPIGLDGCTIKLYKNK